MAEYTTTSGRAQGDPTIATPVSPGEDQRTIAINRISWGAVLAGVAVALVVQILLTMLGVGAGVATLDPMSGDNPSASTFSISAGIWYVVSGIAAAYIGGVIAGRLSGRPLVTTAALHGVISWAATTLIVIYLMTTAAASLVGGAVNGLTTVLGGTAATAAAGAGAAAANVENPLEALERQVREATGGDDPAALRDAAVSAMRAVATGDEAEAQDARERAAQALARAQNIPVEEARTRVSEYEAQYRETVEEAEQQAREAADAAASVVSTASLVAFFALLLGAIASWFGGRAGVVDSTMTVVPLTTTRVR